ncbi:MAG TPA: hemerythrin domain-containing protein [Burkholderiales bacterium]|nr:hemerythrin domain-containing protein [Burkholderiales bacterium]
MAARKKSAARKPSKKKTASKKTASRKSASKKSARASRGATDALTLLRTDHQNVQKLFDQFEKTRSDDRKKALAERICNELTVHAQIEEEIFYPAARGAIRDKDLIAEATVEHQSAKDLIAQIEGGGSGEMWEAKVKVLGEYIKHHVKEEQNELFPQVRKTKLDTKALGEQLEARKMELMGGGGSAGSSGGDSDGLMSRVARGMGLGSGT